MNAVYVHHDQAIDLAADAVDFDLTDEERASLDAHLGWCSACEAIAERMRADDGVMETFTWPTEQSSGYDDEYSPFAGSPSGSDPDDDPDVDPADDDDDGTADDSSSPGDPPDDDDDVGDGDDEDEDEDDVDEDSGEVDEEDEVDKTDSPPPPTPSPELSPDAEHSDDDDREEQDDEEQDDDEDDEEDADDADDEDEPSLDDLLDDVEVDEDEEDDEVAAAAAEAMSDDELGGVGLGRQDGDVPACPADAVERTAEANGAETGARVNERAERTVRDRQMVESTDYGDVAVYRSVGGLLVGAAYRGEVSAAAASAIRNAILRGRTGRSGVARHQAHGTLDNRALHRIAEGDHLLFKRKTAPSPPRWRVWLMGDVSGSMSGQPMEDLARVARALADASVGTPTVHLSIWAWSSPFLVNHLYGNVTAGVVRVWQTGQPTIGVNSITGLRSGGTPDAAMLEWAWREILKECRSEERPVVIVGSDGDGDSRLATVVDRARRRGVEVRSIALGGDVDEVDQLEKYGRGNYVPWLGSVEATARPLAEMLAALAVRE